MTKKELESILEPFLSIESCDGADTLHLKSDILSMVEVSQCLEAFRHLLQDLEACSGKPLILKAERNSFSPERTQQLVKHIGDLQQEQLGRFFSCLSLSEVTVKREENIYGRFIQWLRSVRRPVIMVFQGDTILSFLGIGLACDYRMATSDTVFYNENQKFDMPPGFGLLYLLPVYVGWGRAQSLVTATEPMNVEKALLWGLLDQTVPAESLGTALETQAQHLSAYSAESLGTIKALLNTHLPDFNNFFMLESKGIEQAFKREPWKRLAE